VLAEIGDKYISVGPSGFVVVYIKKRKRTDVRYFFERYYMENGKVMVRTTRPFGLDAEVREKIPDYLDRAFKTRHGIFESEFEKTGSDYFNVVDGKIMFEKTEDVDGNIKFHVNRMKSLVE
jgi:hypothetical protein